MKNRLNEIALQGTNYDNHMAGVSAKKRLVDRVLAARKTNKSSKASFFMAGAAMPALGKFAEIAGIIPNGSTLSVVTSIVTLFGALANTAQAVVTSKKLEDAMIEVRDGLV